MKKLLISCLCLSALFMAASCEKDEVAKKYQVTINVSADGTDVTSLKDFSVKLSTASGEAVELTADELKKATYTANVVAGTYSVSGSASNDEFNFNTSKTITVVDKDLDVDVVLLPSLKQESGIIFKEVYFTGVASYYFQDAFYELVNNSDEVKYLDGIIFGCIDRGFNNETHKWADSLGNIPADFYPLKGYIMQFPGSGHDYPLQPGESTVIANLSMNHSAREITEDDAVSPADLSNADWELYIPTSQRSIDNPDVNNMELIYGSGGFYFMPAVAGEPMALIQLPEGMTAEELVSDESNFHSAPGTTAVSLCVPCDYILDAIDIQRHGETQIVKVFHPAQDAGYTYVTGLDENAPDYDTSFESWESPYYCGKSLRRKCTMVTEGRAYFKDTNNSTEDFILGGQKAVVRRTFTAADAQ